MPTPGELAKRDRALNSLMAVDDEIDVAIGDAETEEVVRLVAKREEILEALALALKAAPLDPARAHALLVRQEEILHGIQLLMTALGQEGAEGFRRAQALRSYTKQRG